jgi:hypothetical protein
MFERPRHRQVGQLLRALDADKLRACGCLFGGGTAMALRFGEYRESVDVDFLVSNPGGYRELRSMLRGNHDLAAISRRGVIPFSCRSEVRADQYGIRTHVLVGDTPIKFEIVSEGRFVLDAPGRHDQVLGVATLSLVDMAASKLLANSDRGIDDGTFNRDLIDLAMMAPTRSVLADAHAKAIAAYGPSAAIDFDRSMTRLRDREGWLERCMGVMDMRLPVALMWQRLRELGKKMAALPPGE